MILLVKSKDERHSNYYEGTHIGFHKDTKDDGLWFIAVVESKGEYTTVESPEGEGTGFYLMNKFGKTIESRVS